MNQLLHIDGITHLYHYDFRLFMVCHGNATYKRLNIKFIEEIDFKDTQFSLLNDLLHSYKNLDKVGVGKKAKIKTKQLLIPIFT